MFASAIVRPENLSLFDFVNTFSNIDIITEDEEEWRILGQAIGSSLPFAGFHPWEAEQFSRAVELAGSYALFPIDRLILWIDGTGPEPKIYVTGLAANAEDVISHPSIDPDLFLSPPIPPEQPMMRLLLLLRFARYYFQFPEYRREYSPESMVERLYVPRPPMQIESSGVRQDTLDQTRTELALLHMLFNSRVWLEAESFLRRILPFLPERWSATSHIINTIFQERIARAGLIGAAAYTPGLSSPLRTRLFARQATQLPSSPGRPTSIIPWTRLSAIGDDNGDCCRYRDFWSGPAVIAWRGRGTSGPRLRNDEINQYSVVVRSRSLGGYQKGGKSGPGETIPIPGFVHAGPALTIRLDHNYVRALSGQNVVFSVGLVRTAPPGQERL